jgi:hypothetical protein
MGLSLCVKVFMRLSKNADAACSFAEKLYASILFLSMLIAQKEGFKSQRNRCCMTLSAGAVQHVKKILFLHELWYKFFQSNAPDSPTTTPSITRRKE